MSSIATYPSTPAALTVNKTGGAAQGTTYDTTVARTFDYSSVGAQSKEPILASSASGDITPDFNNDQYNRTAQSAAIAINNPTGTAIPAFGWVIRIKDNGTARAISFGTQYRAFGAALPTTTVINKTLMIFCTWNSTDTKVDTTWVQEV